LKNIDAAVDCWGGRVVMTKEELTPNYPVAPIDYTKDMSCPLLGLFGEEDKFPTPEQVRMTEEALKKYGKNYEFHMYPGAGHGFFYYNSASYRQEQAVDGWKNPGLFQDRLVREGLSRSELKWCTGTMIPLTLAKIGCVLLPFKDYNSKVEIPTAPELVDYDLYVRRGLSPKAVERTWMDLCRSFASSVLTFTVHPWLNLMDEVRFRALGHVLECLGSSVTCKLEGEICQMFTDHCIRVSPMHQTALKLAARVSENVRNRLTSRPVK
jgi:hypothetical protein